MTGDKFFYHVGKEHKPATDFTDALKVAVSMMPDRELGE